MPIMNKEDEEDVELVWEERISSGQNRFRRRRL
jgi:hypothetical protein